ncbi:MAG: hypothetical protein ACOC8X_04420 [Chloroflexota bacterium]
MRIRIEHFAWRGKGWTIVLGGALFILMLTIRQVASAPMGQTPAADEGQGDHVQWMPVVKKIPPDYVAGPVGPDYGVVFMSSAEDPADEQQYQNALSTGASWNRWPIYWPLVETAEGEFDWSTQDRTVEADLAHGLDINAILLGTPGFYQTDVQPLQPDEIPRRPQGEITLFAPEQAAPVGLYEPVFADGTDTPGVQKSINGANRWARFVNAAVNRYKPGGLLAQANGWDPGVGIRHWEMWNEPELESFWDGSLADYARLLKVGYLAAKHADPEAQVLFGGLANFNRPEYYEEVLTIYDDDPLARAHNYFHDILATHNYSCSWRSWYYVYRAGGTLASRDLQKPIWLNESGVSAWNDYPGPVWDSGSWYRATMQEQADFVIQSAFYAAFAGADVIFHFQLYDGCGNQPAGTDFPPHYGELCDDQGRLKSDPDYPCAGDANGFFSNPTDAACFTQHPEPETARPNYAAYRVLTTYLRDAQPLWRRRPGGDDPYNGPQEWIAFYRPSTRERIVGLWARFGQDEVAEVPAISNRATLVTPDGATREIQPQGGVYRLTLPGATNQNTWCGAENPYAIGGRPYILIETGSRNPS